MAQQHHEKEINPCIVQEQLPPHAEEHGGDGGSLLAINGTLVLIALSFVIFTVVMQKVFYGPMARIREQRKQHIDGIKNAAEAASNKAEELDTEYTEKIKSARKKVTENTAKVMSDANQQKIQILEERKQLVSEFMEEGRKNIREEKEQSLEVLKRDVDSYAADIFKKVLEEDIPVTIGENNERIY